ncbi:MAG: hypothetical protein ACFFE5_01170 [Candidatus Thorarchaeota archaeon]
MKLRLIFVSLNTINLFGDHAIIPLTKDVNTTKERLANAGKDYECFDWCLCHKKL